MTHLSATKAPWKAYPVSLKEYNAFVTDGEAHRSRIVSLADAVFKSSSDILVVDQDQTSSELIQTSIRSDEEWQEITNARRSPQNRIMYNHRDIVQIATLIKTDRLLRISA